MIIFTTVMTFSSLYAPQPIQPLISAEFHITMEQASLLTTICMVPLAIAPVFYGYVLEAVCAKTVLIVSLGFLGFCQFLFFFSNDFYLLMIIRFFEGCAIPAVLTGLMTYISDTSRKADIQKNLAVYISATIFGGFAGRFFSGLISHFAGWRAMFFILGLSLLASSFFMKYLPKNKAILTKIKLSAAKDILANRIFLSVYMLIFFMFFMFAAVLNYIPFRLREINPTSGGVLIGVMYTGYIMGIAVALNIMKIIRILRTELNAIFAGLTIFTGALVFFISTNIVVMFIGMFVFCSGMFLAHTTAAGYVNKLADRYKGVTNGLYVTFYYAGGALGSVIPGFIYEREGWNTFLLVLGLCMVLALIAARIMLIKYRTPKDF